jgi:hypothetical protein
MRFWRVLDGELVQEYNGLAPDLVYSPQGQSFCYGRIDGTLVLAGSGLTGIRDGALRDAAPALARLWQNRPNPFNPATVIRFELAAANLVKLHVYSAAGRRVLSLLDEQLPSGSHEITWSGRDDAGHPVASGVYFYQLEVGDYSETRRMLIVK